MNDFPSVVWRSRQVALGLERGVELNKCGEKVEGGLAHLLMSKNRIMSALGREEGYEARDTRERSVRRAIEVE